MRTLHAHWLLVSILIAPLVSIAAPAPQAAQPAAKATTKAADPSTAATAAQPAMEKAAQKQRESTIAAMQSSIDKQRASVAKGLAASIGKQASPAAAIASGSFFNLPPPHEGHVFAVMYASAHSRMVFDDVSS